MSKTADLQTATSAVASAVATAIALIQSLQSGGAASTPDTDVQTAIDGLNTSVASLNAATTATPPVA